jgi:hypothetical protein
MGSACLVYKYYCSQGHRQWWSRFHYHAQCRYLWPVSLSFNRVLKWILRVEDIINFMLIVFASHLSGHLGRQHQTLPHLLEQRQQLIPFSR